MTDGSAFMIIFVEPPAEPRRVDEGHRCASACPRIYQPSAPCSSTALKAECAPDDSFATPVAK
jgi:hypothetical protein